MTGTPTHAVGGGARHRPVLAHPSAPTVEIPA